MSEIKKRSNRQSKFMSDIREIAKVTIEQSEKIYLLFNPEKNKAEKKCFESGHDVILIYKDDNYHSYCVEYKCLRCNQVFSEQYDK